MWETWKEMACSKVRRADGENRNFQDEWTDKYMFTLLAASHKLLCLICRETVALIKSSNVKWHWSTQHQSFRKCINKSGGTLTPFKPRNEQLAEQFRTRFYHKERKQNMKRREKELLRVLSALYTLSWFYSEFNLFNILFNMKCRWQLVVFTLDKDSTCYYTCSTVYAFSSCFISLEMWVSISFC